MRVVKKVVYTVLGLYVGGTILTVLGDVMNNTASPFYKGLKLIGWTVTNAQNASTDYCYANSCTTASCPTLNNCISDTNGSGALAVIGIVAIAGVVMEFISWG